MTSLLKRFRRPTTKSRKQASGPLTPDIDSISISVSLENGSAADAPVGHSPNASKKSRAPHWRACAEDGLKTVIDILAKAPVPVPGMSAAASAVVKVIDAFQKMKANEKSLLVLSNRFKCLEVLLKRLADSENSDVMHSEDFRHNYERLVLALNDVSQTLQAACEEGNIVKFFSAVTNAAELKGHSDSLDTIILDLLASIGADTNKLVRAMLDEFKRTEARSVGGRIKLDDSTFNGIVGDVASCNQGGDIHAERAIFTNIGGRALCGNRAFGSALCSEYQTPTLASTIDLSTFFKQLSSGDVCTLLVFLMFILVMKS